MPSVLILGASSDIAASLAKTYASHGYDLQLASRRTSRLSPIQSDLTIRYGVSCTMHEFDALDFDGHKKFFDALPVIPDVTICVFGLLGDNEKAEKDWTECRTILDSNYTGAVSILNIAASRYEAQSHGLIIGISSVAGERGRQSNYLYGSAKAGFTAYLSGLRNRLYHKNIHVLTVKPGFVYTRMTEGMPLSPLLTATPDKVAQAIYTAAAGKKNVIYVKWFWRWIMLIIKSIPEFMFKKLKL